MSIRQSLELIAREQLNKIADMAVDTAKEMAPRDLGALVDAIDHTNIEENPLEALFYAELEYGHPQVVRERGYYPGVLHYSTLYGHTGFVNDAADEIARKIKERDY